GLLFDIAMAVYTSRPNYLGHPTADHLTKVLIQQCSIAEMYMRATYYWIGPEMKDNVHLHEIAIETSSYLNIYAHDHEQELRDSKIFGNLLQRGPVYSFSLSRPNILLFKIQRIIVNEDDIQATRWFDYR